MGIWEIAGFIVAIDGGVFQNGTNSFLSRIHLAPTLKTPFVVGVWRAKSPVASKLKCRR